MIRVLVVEDSPVVREFLIYLLESDPQIKVVGQASNGIEAIEAVTRCQPDIITMDIQMPKMDGFEATRQIMARWPTPIVIVSGNIDVREVETTFRTIQAGALAVLERPAGIGHADHETIVRQFLQTVKLMAEVKVVKRWNHQKAEKKQASAPVPRVGGQHVRLVVIGASTGGPLALQTILSRLSPKVCAPLVIVQHMAHGFVHGFAQWLGNSCSWPVQVAEHGSVAVAGHAYVAPDGCHLTVQPGNVLTLTPGDTGEGLCPAVDRLFASIADNGARQTAGILLTGMGKDGAHALKRMRDAGAITIAQNEDSCVVYGMPGEAVKIGAASHVLAPDQIADLLTDLSDARREEK